MQAKPLLLWIMLAGGVGALLRALLLSSQLFEETFIWTFIINMIGAFLIGLITASNKVYLSGEIKLIISSGLLASFTSFSSLILDGILMNSLALTFIYFLSTIIWGIFLTFLGHTLARTYL